MIRILMRRINRMRIIMKIILRIIIIKNNYNENNNDKKAENNNIITSTLRFRSEFAAARRFAKTNHQKSGFFLAIFVDFCPIRRSHWESSFPCGVSRLLILAEILPFFLEIAFSTFPKNCRKFGSA